jgi:hypothetical protein
MRFAIIAPHITGPLSDAKLRNDAMHSAMDIAELRNAELSRGR